MFIYRPPREQLYKRVEQLQAQWNSSDEAKRALPLFGIPYTVKDNIDIADMPTTVCSPFMCDFRKILFESIYMHKTHQNTCTVKYRL